MMNRPAVAAAVNRRLSMMAMVQAFTALVTGQRRAAIKVGTAAVSHIAPHATRTRSRWAGATKSSYNGGKAKKRRKVAHESRRRNRGA